LPPRLLAGGGHGDDPGGRGRPLRPALRGGLPAGGGPLGAAVRGGHAGVPRTARGVSAPPPARWAAHRGPRLGGWVVAANVAGLALAVTLAAPAAAGEAGSAVRGFVAWCGIG